MRLHTTENDRKRWLYISPYFLSESHTDLENKIWLCISYIRFELLPNLLSDIVDYLHDVFVLFGSGDGLSDLSTDVL